VVKAAGNYDEIVNTAVEIVALNHTFLVKNVEQLVTMAATAPAPPLPSIEPPSEIKLYHYNNRKIQLYQHIYHHLKFLKELQLTVIGYSSIFLVIVLTFSSTSLLSLLSFYYCY
jgi:hypothetical protein